MKSFEDVSFKSLLLQGKDLKNTPCSRTECIVNVVFISKDNDRFLSIFSTSAVGKIHI